MYAGTLFHRVYIRIPSCEHACSCLCECIYVYIYMLTRTKSISKPRYARKYKHTYIHTCAQDFGVDGIIPMQYSDRGEKDPNKHRMHFLADCAEVTCPHAFMHSCSQHTCALACLFTYIWACMYGCLHNERPCVDACVDAYTRGIRMTHATSLCRPAY